MIHENTTVDLTPAADTTPDTRSSHSTQSAYRSIELIALGAFLIIFIIGDYLLPFGSAQIHWWADLFWTTGAFITSMKCFAVARQLSGTALKAWRLFGIGCLAWFFGMLIWDIQELLLHELTPFPSLSDIGYYLFALYIGSGLFIYRSERLVVPLTFLELSQFGIFLCCIVLAHMVVFGAPLQRLDITSVYVISALAYPVLFMGILIFSITSIWQGVRGRARRPMGFIIAGFAAHALTNSLYAYELLGHNYQAGHFLDVFWLLGFALIYWGGVEELRQRNRQPTDAFAETFKPSRLAPVLAIVVTIIVIIVYHENLQHEALEQLAIPVVALMLFIALREWASGALETKHAAALRSSEAQLRQILSICPAMISITRKEDGTYLDANEAYSQLTGYSRSELLGKGSSELAIWMTPQHREQLLSRLQAEGTVRGIDIQIRTKSGDARELLASFAPIRIADVDYLIGIGLDVTERRRAEAEMQKLSRAMQQTADAVMITDQAGIIEYVNPAFETITGYSAADAIGNKPNILYSGKQSPDFYKTLWKTISDGEVFNDVFVNRAKTGKLYFEQKTITPLRNSDNEITHFVATGRDISERMEVEERLRFLAHHDTLTELPNRALLLDHLKQSLAAARAFEHLVAVLFLDIDRFKNINDTLGHDAGDALLRRFGDRLHQHLRAHDNIARFGGDEFVIVMNSLEARNDAIVLATRILETLTVPFEIDNNILHVSASIGIAFYPDDGEDSGTLLKNADTAMFRAKELGGSGSQLYSAAMGAHALKRLTLENSLRLAVERNEFILHYQPQMDCMTGNIIGCEALIRWEHPEKGLIAPLEFIPLLEETGLIIPVGRWVIKTGCTQLAHWHDQGHKNIRLAINIASRQFHEPNLLTHIKEVLDHCQIAPQCLELEITESTLMQHIPEAAAALTSLSELGIHIALDDFGTGYSSLSYLRRFPIDTLKIDRSFVRDIPGDQGDTEITRAIIALAQSLHLRTVAEGVETPEQQQVLTELGCDVMQGYLFSKPITGEALTQLLSRTGS